MGVDPSTELYGIAGVFSRIYLLEVDSFVIIQYYVRVQSKGISLLQVRLRVDRDSFRKNWNTGCQKPPQVRSMVHHAL